jgi:hypothetical protein
MVFASGFVVAAFSFLHAVDLLVYPLFELRKPDILRDQRLLDVPTFINGFFALALATAGLWVMIHFQRIHAWMHRKGPTTAPGLESDSAA